MIDAPESTFYRDALLTITSTVPQQQVNNALYVLVCHPPKDVTIRRFIDDKKC